MAHLRFW